ncbi:UDP-N-acetylmuramate--L-alanine ligase [Rubrobacter indicoceani]|uniref:UDP-N-acetylmuramate--L-alanine ligase n=1 Tax=Rubrobacter indicoceani TaxID=2051957 RepID=UPI000E5C2694|nr:UDP-N-acetylmuramate--L-alanine ligase [Rubrobacter indicoceani]
MKKQKIYMVGIGGAGMSSVAEVLKRMGNDVVGSDLKESVQTKRLEEIGITVYIGHDPEQLGDSELVVVSTAIPKTNIDVMEAQRRSIPVIQRAAALGMIVAEGCGVAIAGTHGKTTTTSMTTHALMKLGENPTALVGGELNDIGSNVAFGRTDLIIAEADESDRSLLQIHPEAAVITNIEFDHPDFYSSLQDVKDTFAKFVSDLPGSGHLVVCSDDENCLEAAALSPCPVTLYGLNSGDLRAEVTSSDGYILFENGEERGPVTLGVHGRHNILNSLAAVSVARWLGHDAYEAARTLADFGGVRRRFQVKGVKSGVKVVDDYAHHPTEILATLDVARATTPEPGRVVAVFQPHRYSRTRKLYREFGEAFKAADSVIITEVYGSGEQPEPGVNGKLIVDAICESRNAFPNVYFVPNKDDIPNVLEKISAPEDTVLTLGAGDISTIGEEFLATL